MICEDEITKENPLFICVRCDIKVHKFCYGADGPQQYWKCSLCLSENADKAKCKLCAQIGGAMKRTLCNNWVHVICALFMDGVMFSNDKTMEPVDLSNVASSKRNKTCSFCNNKQGYCATCAEKKCKAKFHITCAQKQNTLQETIDPENDTITFNAYCKDHKPNPDSSRRLSSGLVQNALDNKRNIELKSKVAEDDAFWILDKIGYQSTPARKTAKKRLSK